MEENDANERNHDQSEDDVEEKRDSPTSHQSENSLIIDNIGIDDPIGDYSLEDTPDTLLEGESGNESLLIIKERQKTFERITRSMERNTVKWKRLQEQMVLENVNDDSYSHLIDGRINEIKSMCCSLIRPEYILDSQGTDTRDYAMSLVPISRKEFEVYYRKNWTKLDVFRFAVRMVKTYSQIARAHLKYPWWEKCSGNVIPTESFHSSNIVKYSINKVLRQGLTTNPLYRSNTSIQQILWFNRAIGAFSDLFSVEMEKELSRYISYEIYDDNRVIRCQGHVAHKLYYILAGKIERVRVYRLSEGEAHKSMGFLTHKQMTDFEGFEKRIPSPAYLIARGRLEVLSLHIEDYEKLSKQTDIDSIRQFLQQINIFKVMPISTSTLESQHLRIQYYKHDKVITAEPQRDSYIYVVKSGKVAVARRQTVLKDSGSKLLMSTDVYSLGCRRDGKHASAMQGLPRRQKTFKEMQLEKSKSMNFQKPMYNKVKVQPQTMIAKFIIEGEDIPDFSEKLVRSKTLFEKTSSSPGPETMDHKQLIKIFSDGSSKRKQERQTYVKLDTLKPLDIFGLDSIEGSSGHSDANLVLISEGAEVMLISKRYFLESVDNNTMLEIRKLIKLYLSEEDAKVIIDEDKKWRAYKKVLMERMISLHCG